MINQYFFFFPPYNIEKVDILIDFTYIRIFLIDFFFVNLICGPTSIPSSFKNFECSIFQKPSNQSF